MNVYIVVVILYTSSGFFACVDCLRFPNGFKLGVATAAYQIEGGWNASGKGENIWDRFTHTHPESVADHSNGDVACDSYHRWKDDLKLLRDLIVDHYRFSISWSRILPTGFVNKISQDGVRYYNTIIDDLISYNIEPLVTIYHWDLPQSLQDLGGWTNLDTAEYFAQYSRIVFQLFGDRVKKWITFNEPYSICEATYGFHNGAPNIYSPGIGDYLCGRTVLMAHAKAYRIYDMEFRRFQRGKVGITVDSIWAEPKTNTSVNLAAADREMQMSFGWWAHPIFSSSGDYPDVMKRRIANISSLERFPQSRLPNLSSFEVQFIKNTYDFLGLNHYRTLLVENYNYPITFPTSFLKDKGTIVSVNPSWKPAPDIVPWGLRKLLNWVKVQYNNPLVYITENGHRDPQPIHDATRVLYLKGYMNAVLQAVLQDGCNVAAYTVWSSMDNMEWTSGYTMKFGLYHVDFNSPNRTRTPKYSALFYKNVTTTRILPDNIL